MNLGELKREIKGLGFSDEDTMQEYFEDGILIPAINRAIDLIALTVRPIVRSIDVEVTDEGGGYVTYDMLVLAPDFVDFYGKPVIKREDRYEYVNDYFIEENKKIVMRGNEGDVITVFYKKRPDVITEGTEDSFVIELDELVQPLISLLASYFIWLDDEIQKATMYYNVYDDMKNQILGNAQRSVSARFVGGYTWLS